MTRTPGPKAWAIMAGGGTAGHLLPGLATAEALVERGHPRSSIHFVGSDRGVEADLVVKAGFSLDQLSGRGIQRRAAAENMTAAAGLARAAIQGRTIVASRRPAVVVSLGGHASFAGAMAAVLGGVPLVLMEQNVRAGAANRVLRRFAAASAVSFPGTDLPRAVLTGNPLRPELRAAAEHPDRAGARAALGLPADRAVVLVFTGSQGSRQVNEAVRGLAGRWATRADVSLYHVVGRRDHDAYVDGAPAPPAGGLHYQVVEYEDRMALALAAADVAVTRAGAGTCSEVTAFGLPAVMVPLPFAPRDHQTANAETLQATGGAVVVPDGECDADRLAAELEPLVTDRGRRAEMSAAMESLALPDAAERVAAVIEDHARE